MTNRLANVYAAREWILQQGTSRRKMRKKMMLVRILATRKIAQSIAMAMRKKEKVE